jgi:hypothetical protein
VEVRLSDQSSDDLRSVGDESARPHPSAERALLEVGLIRNWEMIQVLLEGDASRARLFTSDSLRQALVDATRRNVVDEWSTLFAREIDVVRQARNSVVHASDISDENLEAAVTLSDRLLDVLRQRLLRERS